MVASARLDRQAIARRFFERWGASNGELMASFEDTLAVDCRWEQRPMLVVSSRAQAIRFLKLSRVAIGLATVDVELLHVAGVGPVVLTERVDHLLRKDGTRIASAPVAGVLEFDADGRIAAWREHFNAVGFAGQVAKHIVRRGVHVAR